MKKIIILVDVQNGFVKTDYAEETFDRNMEGRGCENEKAG